MRRFQWLFAVAGVTAAVAACSSSRQPSAAEPGSAPASPSPSPSAAIAVPVPHDEHAIHNVYRLEAAIAGGWLISGSAPDGDAGFDELRKMGVKTIISVDGAAPDVQRAEARGMRYVHIPVTYAAISPEQRILIARAVHDLPGPVYIHCHHGKHRGPAAVASAAITLGLITPEQGIWFMQAAGTAPNYQGLYQCVETATPATPVQLAAAPAEFSAVQRAKGMVAAMLEVDEAFENLGRIRAAGWAVPADHPDLVPAAEAGRLADNIRFSSEDRKALPWGEAYQAKLKRALEAAGTLEQGLLKGAPKEQLDAAYKLMQASCKDCHAKYRDTLND